LGDPLWFVTQLNGVGFVNKPQPVTMVTNFVKNEKKKNSSLSAFSRNIRAL
jgi:hypothetical protein